jgi:hypothetical protein
VNDLRSALLGLFSALAAAMATPASAQEAQKPNILVVMGDLRWFIDQAFLLVAAQAIVARHFASFREFPPRQRPGSFSVEQAMEKLRLPPSID